MRRLLVITTVAIAGMTLSCDSHKKDEPASASPTVAPASPAPPQKTDTKPKPGTLSDVGSACVVPENGAAGAELTAGERVSALVTFDDCASTCDEVVDASCSATRSGNTINVTGELTVRRAPPGTVCNKACALHSARCDLGTLKDGEYELHYGGEAKKFTVPGTGACQ